MKLTESMRITCKIFLQAMLKERFRGNSIDEYDEEKLTDEEHERIDRLVKKYNKRTTKQKR